MSVSTMIVASVLTFLVFELTLIGLVYIFRSKLSMKFKDFLVSKVNDRLGDVWEEISEVKQTISFKEDDFKIVIANLSSGIKNLERKQEAKNLNLEDGIKKLKLTKANSSALKKLKSGESVKVKSYRKKPSK